MTGLRYILALSAAFVASPAMAANSWNLPFETVVEIEAKVVDVACTLTGDCPDKCGGGKRQLGLLTKDGKLRLAAKGAVNFAGAVPDLLPHCGQTVFADGLLIENPAMTIFMVQNLRLSKDEDLKPARAFAKEWQAKHGKAKEWYRADPLVKKIIEADGVYGIKGLEPKTEE